MYLAPKEEYFMRAKVVAVDTANDVAILESSYRGKTHIDLGDFDKVNVGDDVIYLGFPFGYNRLTAHKGMISFKGSIDNVETIQIDGIVNRGNSGGPLISISQGEVVGIVYAKEGKLSPYLDEIKNLKGGGGNIILGVIDIQKFAQEVSYAIESHIQLGIGCASSASYAKKLSTK